MKRIFNFTNAIIVLVLILAAFLAFNYANQKKKASLPVTIATESNDRVYGNPDSKVVLVEYADMQCPTCKAFDPIVNEVTEAYKDKIKFVFKYFPLTNIHPNAVLASVSAEAAGNQGKFWEMKKLLFEKQEEWGGSLAAADKMREYALSLGLDMSRFQTDISNPATTDRVMRDYRGGAEIGVNGTPTFYLNGRKLELSEIATVDTFKKTLDAELAKQ